MAKWFEEMSKSFKTFVSLKGKIIQLSVKLHSVMIHCDGIFQKQWSRSVL